MEFLNMDYELLKEHKNAFNKEEVEGKLTDYFKNYDFVVGDYSYGKLRLKGFCTKENKKLNTLNNYNNLDNYLEEYCAFNCPYFILKKRGN